jgi:hypothetical protein
MMLSRSWLSFWSRTCPLSEFHSSKDARVNGVLA